MHHGSNSEFPFPYPDLSSCAGDLRPFFARFYDPDTGHVLTTLTTVTHRLTEHPEEVPATCLGTGARHILHVVRRFMDGDLTLLRHALKLLTVASSSPDTESTLLREGGLQAAMEAGMQGRLDAETRHCAAVLFHSYSQLGSDRVTFVEQGGLDHIARLVLAQDVDTSHSGRGFDVVGRRVGCSHVSNGTPLDSDCALSRGSTASTRGQDTRQPVPVRNCCVACRRVAGVPCCVDATGDAQQARRT